MFVRGYGRASTDAQVLSCEQQEAVCRQQFDVYRQTREDWRNAEWGGFFKDEGTSRLSKFCEREAGSMVLAQSGPGDVVIVSNYDRIFANVVDVCETLEFCRFRKVRLLILDCAIDTTTDFGEGVFKLLAVIKEMDVKEIRRRIRDAAAHRKRVGLPMGFSPPGWQSVSVMQQGRRRCFYSPNDEERIRTKNAYDLYREWELTLENTLAQFTRMGITCPRTNRPWCSIQHLHKWLKACRLGFPLPNGSHKAAPIPVDAEPVRMRTIAADE